MPVVLVNMGGLGIAGAVQRLTIAGDPVGPCSLRWTWQAAQV